MGEFMYPSNNKAAEVTQYEQAVKIVKEAEEVLHATEEADDWQTLIETYDVITPAKASCSSTRRSCARGRTTMYAQNAGHAVTMSRNRPCGKVLGDGFIARQEC